MRGANTDNPGQRNRPTLVRSNGKTITMGEATKMGFNTMELYRSNNFENADRMEDYLQTMMQRLPLGTRLWRHTAMGGYTEAQKRDPNKIFKVFCTYCKQETLLNNDIHVNR